MSRIKAALLMSLLLLLAMFGIVQAYDAVTINGYDFVLLGVEDIDDNGTVEDPFDDTSVWQFAVTGPITGTKGLSHWTLELCDLITVAAPTGSTYTTLANDNYGYCDSVAGTSAECQVAEYPLLEFGPDGNIPYGIKFADASNNGQDLSGDNPGTHIFEITITGINSDFVGPVMVLSKTGNGSTELPINGPSCVGSPSAISLSSVAVNDGGNTGLFVMSLALLVGLLVTGTALWRREVTA